MTAKQTVIDSVHKQLRESSAQLGEERRRLEALQKRTRDRDERRQKIANLRRAVTEERYQLSQLQQQYGHPINGEIIEMHLGDADKGVSLLPSNTTASNILMSYSNGGGPQDQAQNHSHLLQNPNHVQFLNTLPPASVLKARLNAYIANNQGLEDNVKTLKAKSSALEAKYRKIISHCTDIEESKVDSQLEGLFRALDSEPADVELGRINEFLRRVEDVA